MVLSKRKSGILLVSLFVLASVAVAATSKGVLDPPLRNWTAAQTYTPSAHSGIRPLSTQAEIGGGPFPFFPVTPCRQFDIRPGVLPNNTDAVIPLSGAPCGIPSSALAISVNITIFSISGATGNGVLRVGPAASPTTAWINYPSTETQRSNAGTVATDGSGNIVVRVNQGAGSIQLTVDVNGYYYNGTGGAVMPTNDYFAIRGTFDGGGVAVAAQNSGSPNSYAFRGFLNGAGAGSAAVEGESSFNDSGPIYGVKGLLTASSPVGGSAGVIGLNGDTSFANSFGPGPEGVTGINSFSGVLGVAQDRAVVGVLLDSAGAHFGEGQLGKSATGFGGAIAYGVSGFSDIASSDAAGVFGTDSSGTFATAAGFVSAGIRGESTTGYGVNGVSKNTGVQGVIYDTAGVLQARGRSGFFAGGSTFWGLFANGNIGATGTKPFVEPHPTEAGKSIRYVALEGPEAGTYFRGRARFVSGMATIAVPETFRMVSDADNLTVQITPIGELATYAVVRVDLNSIVVKSSKDVDFFYTVNGVRRAYKDWQVVVDSNEFVPESAESRIPNFLSPELKERLIANGTYNQDGSVNLATAERMGWTKSWAERAAQARASRKGTEAMQPAKHQTPVD